MKIQSKLPKPRNPLIEKMKTMKAGTHRKSEKAKRRKEKVQFKREVGFLIWMPLSI